MVIKIKTGKDDLHRNNIMHESADTSAIVDGFFGISPVKKQTVEPSAPKTQEAPARESDTAVEIIEKAAEPTAAEEEMQNPSEKYSNNSTIKETKSEAEKTLDVCIAQIWEEFVAKAKSYSREFQTNVNIAVPVNFENGTLFLDVPTCFAKETIENYYLRVFAEELSEISTGIVQHISVQCASDISESENAFFVKIHKPLIKDERISHIAFRVYAALLFYRNNKSGVCRASVRQIKDEFNLNKNSVSDGINQLINCGYVVRNGNRFEFPFLAENENH